MEISILKNNLPNIVLCGRVNVGKSSLFNLLTEEKGALVSDQSGTTRDINTGLVNWQGKFFNLIDTAGITELKNILKNKKNNFETIENKSQFKSVSHAQKADIILFVVDAKDGVLPGDIEISSLIKKEFSKNTKFILVANKAERKTDRNQASDFYKLAMGEPFMVSAVTGSGIGDLLDEIINILILGDKKLEINEDDRNVVSLSILGQPNVGKSSLINNILKEEKMIVSDIAHTTRESQDSLLKYNDSILKIIDTAGITKSNRRKAKFVPGGKIENAELSAQSIIKSFNSLEKSDVVALLLAANEEITNEDAKILERAIKLKKSVIIVVNKWDVAIDKDSEKYKKYIYSIFPYATWVPIVFLSAKTGEKVYKFLDLVVDMGSRRHKEVIQEDLDNFLKYILRIKTPPRSYGGTKENKIVRMEQSGKNPPWFYVVITSKSFLPTDYLRFIENKLREKFNFLGTPIGVSVKK